MSQNRDLIKQLIVHLYIGLLGYWTIPVLLKICHRELFHDVKNCFNCIIKLPKQVT